MSVILRLSSCVCHRASVIGRLSSCVCHCVSIKRRFRSSVIHEMIKKGNETNLTNKTISRYRTEKTTRRCWFPRLSVNELLKWPGIPRFSMLQLILKFGFCALPCPNDFITPCWGGEFCTPMPQTFHNGNLGWNTTLSHARQTSLHENVPCAIAPKRTMTLLRQQQQQ